MAAKAKFERFINCMSLANKEGLIRVFNSRDLERSLFSWISGA